MNAQTASGTRPPSHWFAIARIAWIAFVVSLLGLFAIAIPIFLREMQAVCVADKCVRYQLAQEEARALHELGLSRSFYAWYAAALMLVILLAVLAIVAVSLWWQPNHRMVIFLAFSLVGFLTFFLEAPLEALVQAQPVWRIPIHLMQAFGLCLALVFYCLFPDGRFVPRWTQALALLIAAYALAVFFFTSLPALLTADTPVELLFLLLFVCLTGAGVTVQIYRYRHVSGPIERQQTKWVIFGLAVFTLEETIRWFLLSPIIVSSLHQPGLPTLLYYLVGGTLNVLCLLFFLLTLVIAILRYRLWDIDVIIRRTLVYGILTICVVGVYILVVGYLGALFQTNGNLLISLLATAVVAVLFQPLRDLLQRTINRLLYGLRDEPYVVLAGLGQRLESTLASDTILSTIVETVRQALKLSYVAIEANEESDLVMASAGTSALNATVRLPLTYQKELVGTLIVAPREHDNALTPADLQLLNDLSHQIGAAVHTVQMTSELRVLTQELQRAREHLVSVREEERRRLRRDLHDGLGPALSAIMLKVGLVRTIYRRDQAETEALLNQLEGELELVISDIRRLVYNLRPPALDELGLTGAIREYVARLRSETQAQPAALKVTVDLPEALPPLPAAVEVAAYRIVQEAMTNVIRHAHAQACHVHLWVDDALEIEVSDNGIGIDEVHQSGVGLNSMRERAEELGGAFRISKVQPWGTRVTASLPLVDRGRTNIQQAEKETSWIH